MKKFWTLIIALAFTGLVFAQTPTKVETKAAAPAKTEVKKDVKKTRKTKKVKKVAKEVKKGEVKAAPAPVTK